MNINYSLNYDHASTITGVTGLISVPQMELIVILTVSRECYR